MIHILDDFDSFVKSGPNMTNHRNRELVCSSLTSPGKVRVASSRQVASEVDRVEWNLLKRWRQNC